MFGENCQPGRAWMGPLRRSWLRDRPVGCETKSLGKQLSELFAKVGSFWPQWENFRLTPEVKEKFTGKLRSEAREFFAWKVGEVVRPARRNWRG